jgi:DNA-binding FadR family transcriptional regulator
MKDKTPEQIIIAEWRAKDAALAEEVERYSQMAFQYGAKCEGLLAENERLKACLHDYENTYPEAKDTLRAEVDHWKAIAQAHNDSLVERIAEVNHWMDETVKKHNEGMAIRAENERLKACLHDYENTYPEAKDTLRAEVDHWKAIAQAHNDSLVARIAEVERLKAETFDIILLRAENEKLREALQQYADLEGPPFFGTPYLARAALRVEESALSAESATYNERWKSKP